MGVLGRGAVGARVAREPAVARRGAGAPIVRHRTAAVTGGPSVRPIRRGVYCSAAGNESENENENKAGEGANSRRGSDEAAAE